MTKTMAQALFILDKAIETLRLDPNAWTQRVMARDENAMTAGFYEDDAVCWCAVGLLGKHAIGVALSDDFIRRLVGRYRLNGDMSSPAAIASMYLTHPDMEGETLTLIYEVAYGVLESEYDLDKYAEDCSRRPADWIMQWNDDQDREVEDVIWLFEQVRERLNEHAALA